MTATLSQHFTLLDSQNGSNLNSMPEKVDAVETVVGNDAVLFATDGQLNGSFRYDLFAVTHTRLLVARKGGKQVDEHDLSSITDITLKRRPLKVHLLEVRNGRALLKILIHSEMAALGLTHTIRNTCNTICHDLGISQPSFNAPSEPTTSLNSVPTPSNTSFTEIAPTANTPPEPFELTHDVSVPVDSATAEVDTTLTLFERRAKEAGIRNIDKIQRKLRGAEHLIMPEETYLTITAGTSPWTVGYTPIILTDHRLLFLADSPHESHIISLGEISSVEKGRTGMLSVGVTLYYNGVSQKLSIISKQTAEPFVNALVIAIREFEPSSRRNTLAETITQGFQPTAIKLLTEQERAAVYTSLSSEIGDRTFAKLIVRGELKHLPHVMMPDELLLWMASGVLESTGKEGLGGGFTLMVLTDRRILLLDKRILAGVQTISVDLDRVNSITSDTGFGFGSIKIQDGADERKIGRIENSTVQPFLSRVQSAIEERKQALANQQAISIAAASARSTPAAPIASPAPQVDIADQLTKLADLLDRGLLTPEEFAEQKAKLLSG